MHGDTPELRRLLEPLFRKYGVHLYFSGHDHNLQHLKPTGFTHYVVSGGGAGGRRVGTHDDSLFARGTGGFVSAALTRSETGSEIELVFIDDDGTPLYRAVLPRE